MEGARCMLSWNRTKMTDDRITILEERIAHLEATVQDLSDVIADQRREMNKLELQHRHAVERLGEVEAAIDPVPEGPPPHY